MKFEGEGEEAALAFLVEQWDIYDYESEATEWDRLRDAATPKYLDAIDRFLNGSIDLGQFRAEIDGLSKSEALWGFKGNSQMFFNQMVKSADSNDLAEALRLALPAPTTEAEAFQKIQDFQNAIEQVRLRAEELGQSKPGIGRASSFLTFFWEFRNREEWPIFFPNSRDVLAELGLLDVDQPQADLYLDYRKRIMDLKKHLGTETWGVERLLWFLGKGSPDRATDEVEIGDVELDPLGQELPAEDLYSFFREEGLHFPEEAVTSLVLSLSTKRFVILSGRSGTGKTRMALGVAQYFGRQIDDDPTEVAEPVSDDSQLFVRLTPGKIKRGHVYMDQTTRDWFKLHLVEMPKRGTSKKLVTRLPDGTSDMIRINNVGFEDPSKVLFRLFFRKHIQEWLKEDSSSGYLRFVPSEAEGVDLELSRVEGSPPEGSDDSRHLVIAVRSDWTDPRGLVGYFNPITNSYVASSLVDLLLAADEDPETPYFVVLDEMNLARVEYYFSDFLSAIESDAPIELMPSTLEEELASEGLDEIPAELRVPQNVSFIGTVNIDETTYSFSPKVLDRANVIEFNEVDVELALGHPSATEPSSFKLAEGPYSTWFCTTKEEALKASSTAFESAFFTGMLEDVHGILSESNLHFGYRVITEIGAYVGHAMEKVEGDEDEVVRCSFDLQLQQKVIPKLSGGRELEEPIAHLLAYSLSGQRSKTVSIDAIQETAAKCLDSTVADVEGPWLPGSARKLRLMLRRIDSTGFVNALE